MQIQIVAVFNPNDVAGKSPDIEFEGDVDDFSFDSKSQLDSKLQQTMSDFYGKFGKRKGKVREIVTWNAQVWNVKVIPHMKFKVKIGGKEKVLSYSELMNYGYSSYKWMGRPAEAVRDNRGRFVTWRLLG